MRSFSGLCAGGPKNGEVLVGGYPTVKIAIARPRPLLLTMEEAARLPPIGYGEYIFKGAIGMWIWKGKWPPK